jgi:hypothetical protein
MPATGNATLIRRCDVTFGIGIVAGYRSAVRAADHRLIDTYRRMVTTLYVDRGGSHREAEHLADALERALRHELGVHQCACCGMHHGRPLAQGEHCDWCRRPTNHPAVPLPLCVLCSTGRGDHHPDCTRR